MPPAHENSDFIRIEGRVSKEQFREAIPELRVSLVNAQYQLKDSGFTVVILLAGRDRIGCEKVIDRLHEWMDARYLDTWFVGKPTDEERLRPRFWRFWRAMPPAGRVGLFGGGWFIHLISKMLRNKLGKRQYRRQVRHFNRLDGLLIDNGDLVLKIWLDLPEKVMKKRLHKAGRDPAQARYAEQLDWEIYEHYGASEPLITRLLADTNAPVPWCIVDGSDERFRDLAIAQLIRDRLQAHLDRQHDGARPATAACASTIPDRLAAVDLTRRLEYADYRRRLDQLQVRLHKLSLKARKRKLASILVFEGWDAAGKGGVIRRITRAVSFRDCKVIPIAAPTDEELAHHYLWRFWRRLPMDGQMRIFDRSWYGRVLVERVESLASKPEWQRAYDEINDFEEQLCEHGNIMLKFWLHIDPDEQLRRFRAREQTPYKKYKITAEDYRNRDKWPAYADAANEMFERTDSPQAPWTLVAANDKRWARVTVLKTLCDALAARLES